MVKAAHHAIKSGHGRYANMKCNHPVRDIHKNKQFRVKACENGHTKLVRFGDSHMKNRVLVLHTLGPYTATLLNIILSAIHGFQRQHPKHRASFRARHKCNQKKSKLTAGYWSYPSVVRKIRATKFSVILIKISDIKHSLDVNYENVQRDSVVSTKFCDGGHYTSENVVLRCHSS